MVAGIFTDMDKRNKGVNIFGKRLADRRRSIYRTQDDVAAESGIKAGSIGRIEQADIVSVYLSTVPKLLSGYRLTVEEFNRDYVVPAKQIDATDDVDVACKVREKLAKLSPANRRLHAVSMQETARLIGPDELGVFEGSKFNYRTFARLVKRIVDELADAPADNAAGGEQAQLRLPPPVESEKPKQKRKAAYHMQAKATGKKRPT